MRTRKLFNACNIVHVYLFKYIYSVVFFFACSSIWIAVTEDIWLLFVFYVYEIDFVVVVAGNMLVISLAFIHDFWEH